MKPLLILSLLCLCLGRTAQSQDTLFRYPCDPMEENPSSILLTSPGPDRHMCLVLRTGGQLNYFLLDSAFKVEGQFDALYEGTTNLFFLDRSCGLKTEYDNGVFQYYFTIASPRMPIKLIKKVIDFKGKSAEEHAYLTLPGKDATLGFILNNEDQCVLVSLYERIPFLYFNRQLDWNQFASDSIDLSPIHELFNKHFGFIHYVPQDQPQRLDNTAERTLAMVRGNQLLLLTEEVDEPLHLAVVDLHSFQAHFKDISMAGGFSHLDTGTHYTVASTLLDDKLFVLRATTKEAEVNVYGLPGLGLLKHLVLSGPIPFTKKPARYNTNGVADTAYPMARYLESLKDGPTGIAAGRTPEGDYLLTIGTYLDPGRRYDKGLPRYISGTGKNLQMPPGIRDVPMYNPKTGLTTEARPSVHGKAFPLDPGKLEFTTTFAKIALDPTTFEVVKAGDTPDAEIKLLGVLKGDVRIFQVGSKYYEDGYSQAGHAFIIREVSAKSL